MKIGFLVEDILNISGGANVIIEYAAGLRALGHEVYVLSTKAPENTGKPWHPRLEGLRLLPLQRAAEAGRFDFVFATWWFTWFHLWQVDADVYGYLNQSLESRFHAEIFLKRLNRITYSLPVLFVTEAKWLAEFITGMQPEAQVVYVRNGLSRSFFPQVESVPDRKEGPLRVLVEGPWGVGFKGVPETFDMLDEARRLFPFEVGWLTSTSGGARPTPGGQPVELHEKVPINQVRDVLRRYDVLIKLSRVEGMFGPPLEMFSQGGTAITYAVTGSDEYMVHGHNGLLVEPYNRGEIVRYLRLLDTRRDYLTRLRTNALETARAFPDWEDTTRKLAEELERLKRQGYRNAHLRGALAALASVRSQVHDEVEAGKRSIGPGEYALLERYRRVKGHPLVRRVTGAIPSSVKQRVRAVLGGRRS
jgi:glycosyltransferase involved in cell wall biosynthesis